MILLSFLSYGFTLFQFLIFGGVWIIFIVGVFIAIRLLLSSYLCSTACNVIAFSISSSLIFQLVTLYHKNVAVQKMILDNGPPMNCGGFFWFFGSLSSHSCSEYYEALQNSIFWQLNVMHVSVTLLKNMLILIASMCGGALGEFLQSFIGKLHWLLHLPTFIVISFSILLGLLAFFGYRFDLFYGLIRIDFAKQQIRKDAKSVPYCDTIALDEKFVECRNEEIQSLLLVNELYQKAQNYVSFMKSK